MDVTTQEIWQAARRLVRTPLFTLTAALTLALAIAANASIFTVVNRVVVNPLPYPQSDRLIALDYGIPARNVASGMNSMAWQLYFQLADHARTLQHVAVYDSGGGHAHRRRDSRAAPNHTRDTLARLSPRRAASTRPVVHRTRRRDGRCACRSLVPWSVGAEIRRRSKHRRPLDRLRRRANRSRRRHAGHVQFP